MESMKKYINCRVYHTGISAAHTIELPGRLVSIVRGDASSVIDYYTRRGFVKHGTAIGNDGRNYTIYANGPDVSAADALVIAIPGGNND